MPLRRITSKTQPGTLADYYRQSVAVPGNREMLQLLPHLEAVCAELEVWSLISFHRLMLLTADDWQSPWLICVEHGPHEFTVRYRLPDAAAPFFGASIVGERTDPAEAAELVRIGLRECGGWTSSV